MIQEAGIIASYTDLLPLVSLLSDDRLAGTANFVADIHGNLVMTPDGHVIQKPPEWAVTNIYKYIQLKVSESSVGEWGGLLHWIGCIGSFLLWSLIHRPSPIIYHPSSTIHHPPSTIHHLPSTIHHPSFIF